MTTKVTLPYKVPEQVKNDPQAMVEFLQKLLDSNRELQKLVNQLLEGAP